MYYNIIARFVHTTYIYTYYLVLQLGYKRRTIGQETHLGNALFVRNTKLDIKAAASYNYTGTPRI